MCLQIEELWHLEIFGIFKDLKLLVAIMTNTIRYRTIIILFRVNPLQDYELWMLLQIQHESLFVAIHAQTLKSFKSVKISIIFFVNSSEAKGGCFRSFCFALWNDIISNHIFEKIRITGTKLLFNHKLKWQEHLDCSSKTKSCQPFFRSSYQKAESLFLIATVNSML